VSLDFLFEVSEMAGRENNALRFNNRPEGQSEMSSAMRRQRTDDLIMMMDSD
jgi:hypothetical protein